jgi:hypothetical protein
MGLDNATAYKSPDPAAGAPAEKPVAIEVRGLKKSFRIPTHRVDSLKERIVQPFAARDFRELQALDDISFEIRRASSSASSAATARARARC